MRPLGGTRCCGHRRTWCRCWRRRCWSSRCSSGWDRGGSRALRAALGAALLGAAELIVLEYDTDVPQFSESLHLPLVVLVGLGVAWIARSVPGTRVRFAWSVLAYLTLRLVLLIALATAGWIAPDVPLALLGLLVLDLPRRLGRTRWPLAGLAMIALQLLASATGISSVAVGPTILAAVILTPLLVVLLVAAWTRSRAAQTATLLVVLAAATALFAPAARAHDPGQGDEVATAEMSVQRGGNSPTTVHIRQFGGVDLADVRSVQVLARRAGQIVSGPLRRDGDAFTGSIDLPAASMWLLYGELRIHDRAVEIWLPVPPGNPALTENRPVYLPAGAGPRPASEYVAGAALLAAGLGLVGWAAVAVRRRAARVRYHYSS